MFPFCSWRRPICNLYSQTRNVEAIRRLFQVSSNRAAAIAPRDAIFPGHTAPVVRLAPDGERELLPMSWGFVLLQDGRAPRRVTNTRDDKLMGRFWRPSFEQRRCLVPATSFCEPDDGRPAGAKATWHWFVLKGDKPRPLFSFAGIWQRWRGPIKKDGPNVELNVYSFMTTVPNSATASINHERSPVILTTDEEREAWLRGSAEEARALVRPLAGERLRLVQVGVEKRDLG
jgi:putative SOS response-associated peptidase YedK